MEAANPEMLQQAFATNVFGPAYLSRAAVADLHRGSSAAAWFNVSSMASADPYPELSIYAATKSALESLARSIMAEDSRHFVARVQHCAGPVETAMLRSLLPDPACRARKRLIQPSSPKVIVDCVCGRRDGDVGRRFFCPIHNPRPICNELGRMNRLCGAPQRH